MSISTPPVPSNVLHLISQIQCEDIRRKREFRETNRLNLTVPVTIRSKMGDWEFDAVSRDLSSQGIGLISPEQIEVDSVCDLELFLENDTKTLSAECIWCRPFGRGFFLSGWNFNFPT